MQTRSDHITAIKVHVALLYRSTIGTQAAARSLAQQGVDINVALRVLTQPAGWRR